MTLTVKWLRNLFNLLIILLVLELVKTIIGKQRFDISYLIASVIASIQILVLLVAILLSFFLLLKQYLLKYNIYLSGAYYYLAIVLILLEGLFAFFYKHPSSIPSGLKYSYSFFYSYNHGNLLQFEKGHAVYDSILTYTLFPDTNFYFKNAEFSNLIKTNQYGLRDDSASLKAPEVICMGDSFTMGWGANENESFPYHIEKILGTKVLNAGIPSYGTARELISLKRFDRSKLKYLIIQYCGNDDGENSSYIDNGYSLDVSSEDEYKSAVSMHYWIRRYYPGKYSLSIIPLYLKTQLNKVHHFFPLLTEKSSYDSTEIRRQAERFLKILYHSDINFEAVSVIITQVDIYKNLQNGFIPQVRELLKQEPYKTRFANQVQTVNSTASLSRQDYYVLDPHLTSVGYQKVARAILDSTDIMHRINNR